MTWLLALSDCIHRWFSVIIQDSSRSREQGSTLLFAHAPLYLGHPVHLKGGQQQPSIPRKLALCCFPPARRQPAIDWRCLSQHGYSWQWWSSKTSEWMGSLPHWGDTGLGHPEVIQWFSAKSVMTSQFQLLVCVTLPIMTPLYCGFDIRGLWVGLSFWNILHYSPLNLVILCFHSFTFPLWSDSVLYISRTGSSVCCSPTQLGPKAFRWMTVNAQNHPPIRPWGRQFSLQFSRQSSKGSVRSLPSPKALGRRRRGLARFQSRRSPGPPPDSLQLPNPDDFQGMAGADDGGQEGTNNSKEIKNPNSQSQSLEKYEKQPQ